MALKICQNLPRTPLGELTTLPRLPSRLERRHPSPYPTPFGTDQLSALAMRPPRNSSQIYAYVQTNRQTDVDFKLYVVFASRRMNLETPCNGDILHETRTSKALLSTVHDSRLRQLASDSCCLYALPVDKHIGLLRQQTSTHITELTVRKNSREKSAAKDVRNRIWRILALKSDI